MFLRSLVQTRGSVLSGYVLLKQKPLLWEAVFVLSKQ
jgi:hypothetical protein